MTLPNDGAGYNPSTNSWTATNTPTLLGYRNQRSSRRHPADGEVSTLNSKEEINPIPVMSLKKTPATRGTRRGRLGESGLFKVCVQVQRVDQVDQAGEEERHR